MHLFAQKSGKLHFWIILHLCVSKTGVLSFRCEIKGDLSFFLPAFCDFPQFGVILHTENPLRWVLSKYDSQSVFENQYSSLAKKVLSQREIVTSAFVREFLVLHGHQLFWWNFNRKRYMFKPIFSKFSGQKSFKNRKQIVSPHSLKFCLSVNFFKLKTHLARLKSHLLLFQCYKSTVQQLLESSVSIIFFQTKRAPSRPRLPCFSYGILKVGAQFSFGCSRTISAFFLEVSIIASCNIDFSSKV